MMGILTKDSPDPRAGAKRPPVGADRALSGSQATHPGYAGKLI